LKLVIAGDAKYSEDYKKSLYDLAGNNENIIFPGFVKGELLEELFTNAKVFVQPSEIEGLSTALLEAMSFGLCCIASDIEENQEALKDYGFYHVNKDVNSLAVVLREALSKPEEISEKGKQACEYVLSNHDWDKIAEDFEQMYKSMIRA
jgi:glycosyltransferase involved in cell wall biosynthesis